MPARIARARASAANLRHPSPTRGHSPTNSSDALVPRIVLLRCWYFANYALYYFAIMLLYSNAMAPSQRISGSECHSSRKVNACRFPVKTGGPDSERQPDPKGDRVKPTLSGKFLPYKEY